MRSWTLKAEKRSDYIFVQVENFKPELPTFKCVFVFFYLPLKGIKNAL